MRNQAALHVHSYYSLLEGTLSPQQIIDFAVAHHLRAVALTDHNLLAGAVEFTLSAKAAGITPILGLEIDFKSFTDANADNGDPDRLVLLCKDETGWANLCKLSSLIQLGKARAINEAHLLEYATGLHCLTGGSLGPINRYISMGRMERAKSLLAQLSEIFPNHLHVEIDPHQNQGRINSTLIEFSHLLSLPAVEDFGVFYLSDEDEEIHRTLSAIRKNVSVPEITRLGQFSPLGAFTEWLRFPSHSILKQTQIKDGFETIELECKFKLPLGVTRFPKLNFPGYSTNSEALRDQAYLGAQKRYGILTQDVIDRLESELAIIQRLGYEPIFLVMQELLQYARSRNILFSSRGSAASSLVAHCLGITEPDPIKLNLYFERFLNPARATPPDIDTDIDSERRHEIIQHVFEIYGRDKTAMVATVNRFRPKSAFNDVAKALEIPPATISTISRDLPHSYFSGRASGSSPHATPDPFVEISTKTHDPLINRAIIQARAILDFPRHFSVHPGGIVISPDEMTRLVPVQTSGMQDVIITQFDLDALEKIGLVKMDLLGIRGLSVLSKVANTIQSWRSAEYATGIQVLDDIPDQDESTAETVMEGKTIGCFQIESPGMRSTLKQIQACTPEDIIAALALYRPGPMRGGLRDAFIRRHTRIEEVKHIHRSLIPILGETYGVILYQEQVLKIANEIAGFSLAEADLLRRAMSHFDPGKQMITLRQKFILNAGQNSGIPEETAAALWEMMAAFAGYGFPKAHAASYAQVSWKSAWCKTHFPAEFLAAVMAGWGGYYSQRVYMMEAKRLGFKIFPPSINSSQEEFCVRYPEGGAALYMGLNQVRDLSRRTIRKIIQYRPFSSLPDFLVRVDPQTTEAKNLIQCGALRDLGNTPGLLTTLEETPHRKQQFSLFESTARDDKDWSSSEVMAAQKSILGISVDYHPLELKADLIQGAGAITTLEASEKIGHKILVAGVRQSHRRIINTKGRWMAFLTLEDFDGSLSVIIPPEVFLKIPRGVFTGDSPLLVAGTMMMDPENYEPVLRADEIHFL